MVSILVPAHNAARTIEETLDSALAQRWARTEIIVVDDGSRDETAAVVRRVGGRRVKLVLQAKQGAAAARNTAYSVCRGEFIQWLDADDVLDPDKVSSQVDALRQMPTRRTLASGGWAFFMYRLGSAQFRPTGLWGDLTPVEWLLRKMKDNLHMQTGTWLVTRELTEAAGPWNTNLLVDDDGEYFCRVLLKSDGVKFVPEAKIYYRMSGGSRLSYIGRSDRKLDAQLLSMRMHIAYLRSLEESPRVREACLRYLRTWLPHFYPNRPELVEVLRGMAEELGGKLDAPILPFKYEVLRRLFGWHVAKQAQVTLPPIRWAVARSLDRVMWRMESGWVRP